MADLKYTVTVNTAAATAGLTKLNASVKSTSAGFGNLKNAMAGLAVAAFVKSAFSMANAMTDLSAATKVSVQGLLGFGKALAHNGGSVSKVNKAVTTMMKTIGDGNEGIKLATDSFDALGLSMEDLNSMNSDDKLKAIIKGLAGVEDVATRTALSMRIFGGSFRGIDLLGVGSELEKFTADAADQAAAVKKAGQANQALKNTMDELQLVLIEVLKPLSDMVVSVSKLDTGWLSWIKTLVIVVAKIGVAIAAVSGLIFVAGILGSAWGAVTVGMTAVSAALASLGSAFMFVVRGGEMVSKSVRGMSVIFGHTMKFSTRLVTALQSLWWTMADSAVLGPLIKGLAILGASLYSAREEASELLNQIRDLIGVTNTRIPDLKLGLGFSPELQKEVDAALEKQKSKVIEINKELEARLDIISKLSDGYDKQVAATEKSLRHQKDMIGLKSDEVERLETIRNFTEQHNDLVTTLKEKQENLNRSTEAGKAEYAALGIELAQIEEAYNAQLPVVTAIAGEIKKARIEQEKALAATAAKLELERKTQAAILETSNLMGVFADSTARAQDKFDELDMNVMEKEIRKISDDIENKLAKQIRKLNSIRTDGNAAAIDEQIATLTAAADAAINKQRELAAKSYEHQREFSYGWRKAFDSYRDDATNAAKSAERIFEKTTSGIEDMIVNLAKTGKFEWKDFASSILEELLRTQLKILAADVFGDATQTASHTAQGVLSGAPGGTGGTATPVKSSGGMWEGIKNIGSSIGSMFGGDKRASGGMGMGSDAASLQAASAPKSGGGLWDGIKSMGSSLNKGIGSMFGGFFADGGTIPKGKFGVVGERGPEMISGPATITPMGAGGGGTNVTYNIVANDAASFKEMIAADPGFIYGVSMQGAKAIPGRR